MKLTVALLVLAIPFAFAARPAQPQKDASFEVAAIKPTPPDYRGGRFATMQGAHQWVERNYTVKYMVAAAYNLPPRLISGGPVWIDTDAYDIDAVTPGETRPSLDDQWSMLRSLLRDRFKLTFHREQRELSVYALGVDKNGL